MAVPTITSVTPNVGHSGGRTLVEISGTNFKLPPAPPTTGKTTKPPPSVRVRFDGRAATNVEVFATTTLYCLTPVGDPQTVDTAFTANASTDVFTANGHPLTHGMAITLSSSGTLPAPLVTKTPYFVRDVTTNTFKLAATPGGVAIDITDAGSGTLTVTSPKPIDVVVDNLDTSGNPIAGETATLVRAYIFERPNLGEESELARVVRAFLRELKRQILPNVSWATHTDYDATTGDLLNLALVEELPALVLTGLELPESREHAVQTEPVFDADAGRFIERRQPVAVDATMQLVGASDNQIEILNLMQAVRMFFKKNPRLNLDRDSSDPTLGEVGYELDFSFGGPVSVQHAGENSNVESFAGTVVIRGILLEDMPGVSRAKPGAIPSRFPHEATRRYGHTTIDGPTAVTLEKVNKA